MKSGDRCRVVSGPHAGNQGTIMAMPGDGLVEIFTEELTDVSVELGQVEYVSTTIEEIIKRAVTNLDARIGQELEHWWGLQVTRAPTDLLALYHEWDARRQRLQARCASAETKIDAQLRAELADADYEQLAQRMETIFDFEGPSDEELLGDDRIVESGASSDEAEELRARVWAAYDRHSLQTASLAIVEEPRNLEIEARIDHDPSEANFLVYADWLQEHGNPRGELIAMDIAGKLPPKIQRERFMVPLSDEARLGATWRAGYLDRIAIATTREDEDGGLDVMQIARVAAASPATRFLRELELGLPSIHEEVHAIAALEILGPRPTLRVLRLTTNTEEEMLSWTQGPELGEQLAALFPNLEELYLHAGSYALGRLAYPRLRKLTLRTCSAPDITPIVETEWPQLEHLELWFGSSSYGAETPIAQLTALLHKDFPKLRSLSLSNGERTDELVSLILASPLLRQLESLALTDSTLTDAGAQLILDNVAKLVQVTDLYLDENFISDAMLAHLQDALNVHSEAQREPEIYEGETLHYANVGE